MFNSKNFIKNKFTSLYSPEQPPWFTRLLSRSFAEPTASFEEIVEKHFLPETKALTDIILRFNPNMTEQKAKLWAFTIHGQHAFYGLCKVPILMLLKKEEYDKGFLEEVAEHVARSTITGIGLPEPKE